MRILLIGAVVLTILPAQAFAGKCKVTEASVADANRQYGQSAMHAGRKHYKNFRIGNESKKETAVRFDGYYQDAVDAYDAFYAKYQSGEWDWDLWGVYLEESFSYNYYANQAKYDGSLPKHYEIKEVPSLPDCTELGTCIE